MIKFSQVIHVDLYHKKYMKNNDENIHVDLGLNPFTPRVISYGDIRVILTSESVDEIPLCDHSNETSSAVLSHGTIYI